MVAMLLVAWAFGYHPRLLGPAFIEGAFGNSYRIAATIMLACPLCLLGLAVVISFRGGVWNIGGEGQYLLGAIAVAALGTHLAGWPRFAGVATVLIAGAAAGAAWSILAGVLNVWRGVQVVLSTILLNFIAVRMTEFVVRGPLVDPDSMDRDSTAAIAAPAELWSLWSAAGLHVGFVVAIIAAIAIAILISRTTLGFRVRAVGLNPSAARLAGLPVERTTLTLFALSGALAGLAGAIEVSGTHHYLTAGFSAGYGYTAIAVALLARLSPMSVIPAALFFAAIDSGTRGMQKLPIEGLGEFPTVMKFVAQGVVVLTTLVFSRVKR